jgi:hypothetical protein
MNRELVEALRHTMRVWSEDARRRPPPPGDDEPDYDVCVYCGEALDERWRCPLDGVDEHPLVGAQYGGWRPIEP